MYKYGNKYNHQSLDLLFFVCLKDSIPRVKPYTYYISLVHPLRNEPRPCLGFVHYQLRHTTRSLFAHTPPWPHLSRGPVWIDSVNLFFPSTPPLPLWSPSLSHSPHRSFCPVLCVLVSVLLHHVNFPFCQLSQSPPFYCYSIVCPCSDLVCVLF